MVFLNLMPWEEAQYFRRVWLTMPHKENDPFIPGLGSLGGLETNLNFLASMMVLESCAYCPEKQDAGERQCVIQALASVQMQKYGFEPFFG